MRLVATRTIEAGVKLAKTITNKNGQVLLYKGVALSEKMIQRLLDVGIQHIYIEDERTSDIVVKEAIPDELRKEVTTTIESTFTQIQTNLENNHSLVIENASKKLANLIKHLLIEIKSDEDLLSLLADVYIYDEYIFTHSLNVTLYSLAIGQKLQLPPSELETLGLGALLHDVGKMKVRTEVLMKPGQLTEEEFIEMQQHPTYGFQLLKDVHSISLLVAHCAYQHHERMNGTGYPRGLKGNDIHLFGRIIAVADVFDAVTSNRVYRKAMLPHEGLEILFAGAGTLFDPQVVDAFRHAVAIYPVGMVVQLNDGSTGIIVKQNVGFSDRPIVRILEKDGQEVQPYELDLTKKLDVVISGCHVRFKY